MWYTKNQTAARMHRDARKGFLTVLCEHCGAYRSIFTREVVGSYRCRLCGGETEIASVKPVDFRCACGKMLRYATNTREERFPVQCVECRRIIDVELNEAGSAYSTVRRKGRILERRGYGWKD